MLSVAPCRPAAAAATAPPAFVLCRAIGRVYFRPLPHMPCFRREHCLSARLHAGYVNVFVGSRFPSVAVRSSFVGIGSVLSQLGCGVLVRVTAWTMLWRVAVGRHASASAVTASRRAR